jgi:hypothetical protein
MSPAPHTFLAYDFILAILRVTDNLHFDFLEVERLKGSSLFVEILIYN